MVMLVPIIQRANMLIIIRASTISCKNDGADFVINEMVKTKQSDVIAILISNTFVLNVDL